MQTETNTYADHLASKSRMAEASGFACLVEEDYLFPFQRDTVRWALKRGRAAIFADTGLGKTVMQLTWAHHVVRHTGGKVLLLAPLAVGAQTVREAQRFGIPNVRIVRQASDVGDGINVCNYDRLHKIEGIEWAGVVLDESSILKSYMGKTKRALVAGFADVPFRLACTATPAPNDYLELGNHAEFLSIMSSHQMIARWFISDQSAMGTYRLKGHAKVHFWDWVASWARCIGVPSDMGNYSDEGYILPPLDVRTHAVGVDVASGRGDGDLFRVVDLSATAIHREKRRTNESRAQRVAEIIEEEPSEPWLVWCETNYEAEALMSALPDHAVEVRGSHSSDEKARRLMAFTDEGGILVTKPKIAGFGMNWQHCARIAFVGGSYSYEAFYQAVRRCWRFGQPRSVVVHVVMAVTESHMWSVVQGKADSHERMKVEMFAASKRAAARSAAIIDYHPTHTAPIPAWLRSTP